MALRPLCGFHFSPKKNISSNKQIFFSRLFLNTFIQTLRFRVFAGTEAEESSPLYHRLALAVADDPEMLALAAHARSGQPPANLLLGAVHFLLLRSPAHVLADYYADLTPAPRPPTEAATPFRDFCLEQRAALVEMLRTRLVQTNELRLSVAGVQLDRSTDAATAGADRGRRQRRAEPALPPLRLSLHTGRCGRVRR